MKAHHLFLNKASSKGGDKVRKEVMARWEKDIVCSAEMFKLYPVDGI